MEMNKITREDLGYLTQELAEVRKALQDIAIAIAIAIANLGNKKSFSGSAQPSQFSGCFDISIRED